MREAIEQAVQDMDAAKTMGHVMRLLAMAQTKGEADALRAAYLASVKLHRPDDAEAVVSANIGYMTGYYDRAEAARLLDLYDASHPVFGRTHADGTLTPEDAK